MPDEEKQLIIDTSGPDARLILKKIKLLKMK